MEWLDGYLKKFYRRLKPPEWPEPGTDEYADYRDDWAYALRGHNVTEEEADEVLMRLRQDPPQWLREHLPKFMASVEAIRRERLAKGQADDRDTAQAASRGCPHCAGSGQAIVFDRDYDGRHVVERECHVHGEAKVIPYAMTVSAHCVCAMGRWMRGRIRDLDVLARTPDFADVLAGRSRWLAQDPTRDEDGEYAWDFVRRRRELAAKITAQPAAPAPGRRRGG